MAQASIPIWMCAESPETLMPMVASASIFATRKSYDQRSIGVLSSLSTFLVTVKSSAVSWKLNTMDAAVPAGGHTSMVALAEK